MVSTKTEVIGYIILRVLEEKGGEKPAKEDKKSDLIPNPRDEIEQSCADARSFPRQVGVKMTEGEEYASG